MIPLRRNMIRDFIQGINRRRENVGKSAFLARIER